LPPNATARIEFTSLATRHDFRAAGFIRQVIAMKPRPPRRPRVAVGIIERHDNHVLIVLPSNSEGLTRLWQFPRGYANADESPEQAMRRIAEEQIGVRVEVVVGRPPVTASLEGREIEMRCFFCGIADGEPHPGPYAEIRWVTRGHLREYEFDVPSKPIVDWLLET